MVELVKREDNQAVFKFSLAADEFEKAVTTAFNRSKNKFKIPGFRAGKVPRKIIEKHYGEGVFYEDAINIALPKAYEAAVAELGLDTVDRPDIDIVELEPGKDVIVEATVTLKPEVELGAYQDIEVKVAEATVSDEDVDAQLSQEQEKNSRMIAVEDRPSQLGDTVIIDYKGSIDGDYFDGGSADNHSLKLGSKSFIGDFEDQLVGLSADDDKNVQVSFPEDYHADHLAGKPAVFEVHVHEIKTEEMPELDDEFIKDISEFDTVAEYREDAKAKLLESAVAKRDNEIRNSVIEQVVDNALVDIPEVMVDQEIDNMLMEFDYQLRYQGMSLDKYFELTGSSEDDMREKMQADAQAKVKTSLVVEAIAKKEAIEATEEDLNTELARIAELQKSDIEKVKEIYGTNDFAMIKDSIVSRKTVDFIVDNAKVSA